MKVLFLNPPSLTTENVVRDSIYGCWCKGRRIGGAQMPPTNLLSVATVLKEDGRDVEMVDAAVDGERWASTEERIEEFGCVIMLVSSSSFQEDCGFVAGLKARNPDLLSVFFGPHPTFMPSYTLESPSVDLIVMREPELILRDLARALDAGGDWKSVPGLGYR
ncbi:MAG: cobalamin-dependent protein, partial [Proteobacteria bacterium]|nr:cobalamin-dependent protein [Pseudomonadota bacterium]